MEKYIPSKWEANKAGVAILILDKIDLKIKIRRDKEGQYIMIKGSIQEEDKTIVSIYAWRRQWHPTPVLCLENPMDGGAWKAAVHGVAKSRTQLSDFTFTFHFHELEKEMETHSSVLAWRIPGTGEPGGVYGVAQSRTRLK